MNELVSVVIPVRDGGRFLAAAIESVLAQDYEPLEVIVVDDGSTDDSFDTATKFGSPVRLVSQAAQGVAAALNHGVQQSSGGLLAFVDADDLWTPGKLNRQAALLAEQPGLDAVFGHAEHFRGDDPTVITIRAQPAYSKGTMLIRRAAYDRAGAFSSEWRLGEFVDWYARAVDAGVSSVMLPDVLLLRRVHDNNMGVLHRADHGDYARVLKAVLDRRRAT
jgi:glycosyltransferase involved in cell wall biosynthesis